MLLTLLPHCDSLQRSLHPLTHKSLIGHRPGAHQHSGHRIVIALRERIEFVIVTPSTSQRHSQHRPGKCVDLLVDNVDLHLLFVLLCEHLGPQHPKSSRRNQAIAFLIAKRRTLLLEQQIPCNLLLDKRIETQVLIQRVDDPIAIPPSVGHVVILIGTIAVGIPHQVQPMPAPTNPISVRSQQPIDESLVAFLRPIPHIGLDLLLARGQTRDSQRRPTQQHQGFGSRIGLPTPLLELRLHKRIDRIAMRNTRHVPSLCSRQYGISNRLKRPMAIGQLRVDPSLFTPR